MKINFSILINLLPYKPAYTGLSRYVERILNNWEVDHNIPLQLRLKENGKAELTTNIDLPKKQSSPKMQWLQKNALVQHAVNVRDLVEKADPSIIYSPFTDRLLGINNRPQIITCHDLTPLYFPSSCKAYWRSKIWLPIHLNKSSKVIAISKSVADLLVASGMAAKKIFVIYNGVELIKNPVKIPITQNCLVLARHAKNKNLDLVLNGFAKLIKLSSNWEGELVIVGSKGKETRRLKKLEKDLGLTGRIRWLPPLDQNRLETLWRNCFCLIAPSLMEGFDYPLMEAKARGLPTLASRISSHVELHAETSLLFEVNDGGVSLASQLQNLSQDNSIWQQLSQTGLTHARLYSLKRQTQSIQELLVSTVNGQ